MKPRREARHDRRRECGVGIHRRHAQGAAGPPEPQGIERRAGGRGQIAAEGLGVGARLHDTGLVDRHGHDTRVLKL